MDHESTFIDVALFHAAARKGLTKDIISNFQDIIYDYYTDYGRKFPWRETNNPYHIVVSEFMLQQTQTSRVETPYTTFITLFPDFPSLAAAPLQAVLTAWRGLGYNRRALNLKKTAEIVTNQFDNNLPRDPDTLMTFPGIGRATAGAIACFAFQKPVVFIETNIRTVYIYFFFQHVTPVKDTTLLPLVKETLDITNPRYWYYALMDYGVMLKKRYTFLNKKSAHYQKQPPFKGSDRQIRGLILKKLVTRPYTEFELLKNLKCDSKRGKKILFQLEKEGFIKKEGDTLSIAS